MNRKLAALALAGVTAVTGVGTVTLTQANAASVRTCSISSTPTLRQTSSDRVVSEVKTLQCQLNEQHHADLKVDGIFGPKTDAAVRSYQRSKGLVVDGIVGPKTWGALKDGASSKPKPQPTKPEPGDDHTSEERQQVLKRAHSWLNAKDGHPVPYSQSDYFHGYRTDCSGFASMALELSKPGTNTVGLASSSISRRIDMKDLKPGDLVIDANGSNTTRHVVIFEKWDNDAKSSYTAYEQSGDGGTHHRSRTYGLDRGSEYHAYRPNKYKN